jgi:hypothetical protein
VSFDTRLFNFALIHPFFLLFFSPFHTSTFLLPYLTCLSAWGLSKL